jgi:hypothetical protein
MSRDPTSIRIASWAVNIVSRALSADERDAVLGDFAESAIGDGGALRDLMGLVIRRQAGLWLAWRPWFALVGIVIPVGLLISHVTRWWAHTSAIYAWLYLNNWTWYYLRSPGARLDLASTTAKFLLVAIAIVGWSWASGFACGSLSRRTLWISAILFGLAVIAGTAGTTSTVLAGSGHSPVFAMTFYRVVFPLMLQALLVLVPAVCGMHRSLSAVSLSITKTSVGAVVVVVLTLWMARGIENSVTFGRNVIPPNPGPDGVMGTADDPRPLWPLSLVMLGPVGYAVVTAGAQHRRSPPASR